MASMRLPDWLRRVLRLDVDDGGPVFPQDSALLTFFTNVDHIVEYFERQLEADADRRRLLIVHGVGGIGKSSLLGKLRACALSRKVPIAYSSGDTAATSLHVFRQFSRTMRRCGSPCRLLDKAIKKHASLQAKVSKEGSKLPEAILTGGGAVASTALSGNPALGAAAGRTVAAGVDWLRSVLPKPDLDLYLDPTRHLTDAFLGDLMRLEKSGTKCVLMFDTYERLAGIDPWVRDLVLAARQRAFIVIAGRDAPAWDRDWPGWMAEAYVEELLPMSAENMRSLVRRYYRTIRGGEPASAEVEAIVAFARGLPLVVTTAVTLWVKFNVARFETVKPQVIADLVDRIMEGVPATTRPWLEAAAALRWFNQPLLKEVLSRELDDDTYNELRHFPFVRPHEQNVMIHDAIREIVDENCRTQNPTRHSAVHTAAAAAFRKAWLLAVGEARLPLLLESLFHSLKSDEEKGRVVLREACEELADLGLMRHLRAVLTDAAGIKSLDGVTSLWLKHYTGRALQIEGKIIEAETIFNEVCVLAPDGSEVQRYAHCGLAGIITRWDRLGDALARTRALEVVEVALGGGRLDTYLANALFFTARVKASEGDWKRAVDWVERAQRFYEESQHLWGVVRALNEVQAAAVLQGDWDQLLKAQNAAVALLTPPPGNMYLRAKALGYWSWGLVFAGRCRRVEVLARESEAIAEKLQDAASACIYSRNVGLSLAMQQKYAEGIGALRRSVGLAESLGRGAIEVHATSNAILGMALTNAGEHEEAQERLGRALREKEEVGDVLGMPETLTWLGHLALAKGESRQAIEHYHASLKWKWTGRRHCESDARLGVCRALYALGSLRELDVAMREAEPVASYYHEHMAWLELLKGHVLWSHPVSKNRANEISNAYGAALLRGVQHNRFVLDRVLDDIRLRCADDKDHGRAILAQLATFWRRSVGPITQQGVQGYPYQPAAVPLIELEKRARAEEPGNGHRQTTVLEVLSSWQGSR